MISHDLTYYTNWDFPMGLPLGFPMGFPMVLDDSREGPTDLTRDVDDVDTWNYLYHIYM